MFYYDGTIDIVIDAFPHCLIHNRTGESVPTVVQRILQPDTALARYTKGTGWYVDWSTFPPNVEIYAIITPDDNDDIQGLFGVCPDEPWQCARLAWGCSAPWNTAPNVKYSTGEQRYGGVGLHIFAGAHRYSNAMGYKGGISGCAANDELLRYYVNTFGAIPRNNPDVNNPNFFVIPTLQAQMFYSVSFIWKD